MQIYLDGESVLILEGITLWQYLQEQEIDIATVILEYNGQILTQDQWKNVSLQDGDVLEVFNFVGGG